MRPTFAASSITSTKTFSLDTTLFKVSAAFDLWSTASFAAEIAVAAATGRVSSENRSARVELGKAPVRFRDISLRDKKWCYNPGQGNENDR